MSDVLVDRGRFERLMCAAEALKEWVDAPIGQMLVDAERVATKYADALQPGDFDPVAPLRVDCGRQGMPLE